jgi:hypothetical protein
LIFRRAPPRIYLEEAPEKVFAMEMQMDVLERGRIATWSKEKLSKLTTLELRALLANAERLQEEEVAALCNELLDARPRGRPPVRRDKHSGAGRRLITRAKAFEKHGVIAANRVWSRGAIRTDGAERTVVFLLRADEVQKTEDTDNYLLWAPNVKNSHSWSDTPGGQERLEHCRIALERGVAEGMLIFGKGNAHGTSADRVDAGHILNLSIEKRRKEYWATCAPAKRVTVITHQ